MLGSGSHSTQQNKMLGVVYQPAVEVIECTDSRFSGSGSSSRMHTVAPLVVFQAAVAAAVPVVERVL